MDPPKILQKSQNVTRQILKEPFEGLFKSSRNIPLKIKKKKNSENIFDYPFEKSWRISERSWSRILNPDKLKLNVCLVINFVCLFVYFSTFEALFKNDLAAEWNKLDKSAQRSAPVDNGNFDPAVGLGDHNENTWPASLLIERLKTLITAIIRDPAQLSAADVLDMLRRSEQTLLARCDVTASAFKCLLQLSFDFVFILCTSLCGHIISRSFFFQCHFHDFMRSSGNV